MDKLILSDLENELQRGQRAYKLFEKALEAVESLRSLEADASAAQKKLGDANAEIKKNRDVADAELAAIQNEVEAAKEAVENAKGKAAVIIADAENKADAIVKQGKDLLAAERVRQADDIQKSKETSAALKSDVAGLVNERQAALLELAAVQGAVNAIQEQKSKLLEAFK
jgi:hypothetical protein